MTAVLIVLVIATVVTDILGEPPTYLVGMLGSAAGVWFGAMGSDKQKKDADTAATATAAQATAERAEAKADTLAVVTDHADVVEAHNGGEGET
jgi:hypothetical protein